MNRRWTCLLGITAAWIAGLAARTVPDESLLTGFTTPDPQGYFLAAEQLAEHEATTPLARETFALVAVLAAELDPSLAAGACVALAALSPDAAARDGLWSLAVELDPARADDRRWLVADAAGLAGVDSRAAQTLGMLRHNDPQGGAMLDEQPALLSRLVAEAERLGHDRSRFLAVLGKWKRDAGDDPCGGRMTVRERRAGSVITIPCPNPSFHHGVRTDQDWSMMVGVEMALLSATPESWPGQAAVGLDAAVPVWTLDRVVRAYGVSADRPLRRAGRWTGP